MTIPEAVQLIVQAGAIGESGDIFVLDMGKPVKIIDLAHNMIRLSGKEPERDIPIEFIGVRPGRSHEDLWGEDEASESTSHPKILRATRRRSIPSGSRTSSPSSSAWSRTGKRSRSLLAWRSSCAARTGWERPRPSADRGRVATHSFLIR